MALTLSLQECALLTQVLTRFLKIEGHEDLKDQAQVLYAKLRNEVLAQESVSWDAERIQEESPAL
jgi:hypothetical protein